VSSCTSFFTSDSVISAASTACADSTCTNLSRSGTVIHIISGRRAARTSPLPSCRFRFARLSAIVLLSCAWGAPASLGGPRGCLAGVPEAHACGKSRKARTALRSCAAEQESPRADARGLSANAGSLDDSETAVGATARCHCPALSLMVSRPLSHFAFISAGILSSLLMASIACRAIAAACFLSPA
jgi:hypothetical protein